jgi:hypothetical protein
MATTDQLNVDLTLSLTTLLVFGLVLAGGVHTAALKNVTIHLLEDTLKTLRRN